VQLVSHSNRQGGYAKKKICDPVHVRLKHMYCARGKSVCLSHVWNKLAFLREKIKCDKLVVCLAQALIDAQKSESMSGVALCHALNGHAHGMDTVAVFSFRFSS
jgi:hypothetical protein